jgi:uncharacterized protein (TIGR03066 family)
MQLSPMSLVVRGRLMALPPAWYETTFRTTPGAKGLESARTGADDRLPAPYQEPVMKCCLALAVVCLLFAPERVPAADPKLEDLLGKWELTEEVAGIPKGAIFDFQKDGKLVVMADVGGEKKKFDFKYELKEKQITFTIGGESNRSEVVTLDKTDLVLKDNDVISAKFKRAK